MLQLQYVDVNKLNAAGKVQIGQKFETLPCEPRPHGERLLADRNFRTALFVTRHTARDSFVSSPHRDFPFLYCAITPHGRIRSN